MPPVPPPSNPNWGSQQIPYSQEAEEAALGSFLVSGQAIFSIMDLVEPEDFFILRHKYIYEAALAVVKRGEPIDPIVLGEQLKAQDRFGEVGGFGYLTQLINNTPTHIYAANYAELVARAATRRRLMTLADTIKALALDTEKTVEDVVTASEQGFLEIVNARQQLADVFTMQQVMSETWDHIEKLQNETLHLSGLSTGFTQLDEVLGGLQAALYIVAGRPGMGKSGFLTKIGMNVAKLLKKQQEQKPQRRPPVVIEFNLEMTRRQVAMRILSAESGVPSADILTGQMSAEAWKKLTDGMGDVSKMPFLLSPLWKVTPNRIRAVLKRLNRFYDVRLVIVDYIQRMKADGKQENRVLEIGAITRGLVEVAMEFQIPVLAAAQLSREVEKRRNKRPMLSDLKESGDIEQDAHAVLFLYRDDYYKPKLTSYISDLECNVAKNREGPTGMIPFLFNRQITDFEEGEADKPSPQAQLLASVTGDDEDEEEAPF